MTNTNKRIFSLGENKLTTNYESILNLGQQPWGNDFLSKENLGKEYTYPLNLVYCYDSQLLQLDYFIKKETMFSNHTYVTTPSLLKDFHKLAEENYIQFSLNLENDMILDIGGNDGSQLLQYRKLGFKNLINFESAKNIAELSNKNQVYCINDFFNLDSAQLNLKEKSVKLINASGVFFHLEELDSVIKGINYCLADDGIFIVQFMYAGTMIDNLNFDTIYHEHLCYYTVNSIIRLLEKYGIYIQDAYFTELHSGSIFAKFRKYKTEKTERCINLIEKDKKYNLQTFKEFSKKIESKRYDLKNLLTKLKSNNKKIYGYGAPVKGNTLMNYMGIDNSLIDKVVEVNTLKVGLYTPGSHIPVELETSDDLPDYYLLLSHILLMRY
jgi:hypothetical protein